MSELERKLICAARLQNPGEQVPYAFEKRVMAHILSRTCSDAWALWAQALWRSAGACLAIVILLGAVSVFAPAASSPAPGDLSLDFEKTMLAALENEFNR